MAAESKSNSESMKGSINNPYPPPHQTLTVFPDEDEDEEPSPPPHHTLVQAQSKLISPQTSMNHATLIPNTSTQTQPPSDLSNTNQSSITVSVGATRILILQDPPPPLPQSHSQSLNISNIGAVDNQQAPYISPDHLRLLLQTHSLPQPNPPYLPKDEPQTHPTETKPNPPPQVIPNADILPNPPPPPAANVKKRGQLANRAANLANLLPTGTVLAFQALTPSLSNNGKCQNTNKVLVALTVTGCAVACLLSSFTDSFAHKDKLYYGIVTSKGLCVLNTGRDDDDIQIKELAEQDDYKISGRDFVLALGSLLVFIIFAFSSTDVLDCFFPGAGEKEYSVILYMPLLAGILSSCFFTLFPTKRKGIGYSRA